MFLYAGVISACILRRLQSMVSSFRIVDLGPQPLERRFRTGQASINQV
jgi:hypothetical protein